MITYCVILLLLALGQGSLSQANNEDCSSSSQTTQLQSAMDELSSQLNVIVDKKIRSFDTGNTEVVSSSLLQLVLLQHIINGDRDTNNHNDIMMSGSCNESVQEIFRKLDNISSSVGALAHALCDKRENTSTIDALTAEVRESKETIKMLVEMVDSSRRAVESLTAIATHLNSSVIQLQQHLDTHDQRSLVLLHSCQQIKSARPDLPSGYYTITSNEPNGQAHTVYCNMEELCGSGDGWTRVAYLNMTDSQQQCPSTLQLYQENGVRACGRKPLSDGCRTVGSFSSFNIDYTEVCGRIIGYQYVKPDGFSTGNGDLNSVYVDGISLTHGSTQRQHIWTFAASEAEIDGTTECPCGGWNEVDEIPSDIGDHYFCESGSIYEPSEVLYTADPLWDGKDCNGRESPCCASPQFNPPWFHRVLDTPTSDDIDMRTCLNFDDEDTPLELYEIYVK